MPYICTTKQNTMINTNYKNQTQDNFNKIMTALAAVTPIDIDLVWDGNDEAHYEGYHLIECGNDLLIALELKIEERGVYRPATYYQPEEYTSLRTNVELDCIEAFKGDDEIDLFPLQKDLISNYIEKHILNILNNG